jgi:RNA polymerase sigma-70 factor (ECF subfamily)
MGDAAGFERRLRDVRSGDRAAAEWLFRTYDPMLRRYVRSQEPRVADDLAGEVWLAAIGALDSFEGDEEGFRAWLFTVARRRVIEHRRKGLRRRTDSTDPEQFLAAADPADVAERAAAAADAHDAVGIIAEVLSPEQAEVLILRVVADLSAAQVGELLGRPEAWVRITQHRALKKLAARLDARMQVTT